LYSSSGEAAAVHRGQVHAPVKAIAVAAAAGKNLKARRRPIPDVVKGCGGWRAMFADSSPAKV
jgi:hypothetical protein